jgi:hypothetical protein
MYPSQTKAFLFCMYKHSFWNRVLTLTSPSGHPKTQTSHISKGGVILFCILSLWRSDQFFGLEIPGIKGVFVTAVSWPKLDRNTRSKCHSLCDKLLEQVEMSHCDKRFVGLTLHLGSTCCMVISCVDGSSPYTLVLNWRAQKLATNKKKKKLTDCNSAAAVNL